MFAWCSSSVRRSRRRGRRSPPPALRDQIDGLGRAAHEHDLLRRRSVQEARAFFARCLVGVGRARGESVRGAVNVRVLVLVEVREAIDDGARLLRGGRVVEPDEAFAAVTRSSGSESRDESACASKSGSDRAVANVGARRGGTRSSRASVGYQRRFRRRTESEARALRRVRSAEDASIGAIGNGETRKTQEVGVAFVGVTCAATERAAADRRLRESVRRRSRRSSRAGAARSELGDAWREVRNRRQPDGRVPPGADPASDRDAAGANAAPTCALARVKLCGGLGHAPENQPYSW